MRTAFLLIGLLADWYLKRTPWQFISEKLPVLSWASVEAKLNSNLGSLEFPPHDPEPNSSNLSPTVTCDA